MRDTGLLLSAIISESVTCRCYDYVMQFQFLQVKGSYTSLYMPFHLLSTLDMKLHLTVMDPTGIPVIGGPPIILK